MKINACGSKIATRAKTVNISVSISLPKVSNLSTEQVCRASFLTKVEHTRLCVSFFLGQLGNHGYQCHVCFVKRYRAAVVRKCNPSLRGC